MNLEIEKFKNQISKFDFNIKLGYSFFDEMTFNENSPNEFFRCQFKNSLNKLISFTYYPCDRLLTSNEIEVLLIYPNGCSVGLSEYLAYKHLKKRLSFEDVVPYRFKVDCENLEKSIICQLNQISNLLHFEFKKYLITEELISIPYIDPRDEC